MDHLSDSQMVTNAMPIANLAENLRLRQAWESSGHVSSYIKHLTAGSILIDNLHFFLLKFFLRFQKIKSFNQFHDDMASFSYRPPMAARLSSSMLDSLFSNAAVTSTKQWKTSF